MLPEVAGLLRLGCSICQDATLKGVNSNSVQLLFLDHGVT